jgi:cell division protein FtsI (penicillin-binding protein 3)
VSKALKLKYRDASSIEYEWASINSNTAGFSVTGKQVDVNRMPALRGLGLKDAVLICENLGLKVEIKGKGKVTNQSIVSGQSIAKGQIVTLELGLN